MATESIAHVSIVVFKSTPVDYQKLRHAALWFQFDDKSGSFVIHAVGVPSRFSVQVDPTYDPLQSTKFAKQVDVGYLKRPMTSSQLQYLMRKTEVDNSDREFNCQVWVQKALERLKDDRQLSEEEYSNGLDGLVDATMEAEDEADR
ncbi:uncharacterized protein J3D65DRAFT_368838 [Phyllosticta citribraziliensis]|uniref:Uncharacterized protein n=1 Tax=Phyllosticta citribraziliensis TaxID=989973 RepID=A0ABR1LTN8_9PEZI